MPFSFRRKPKDDEPPQDELVVVQEAENQMAADMTLGILRMHAIPCMSRPRGMGFAYVGLALQPHDILVRAADRDRAEAVLRAFTDEEDVELRWR